jgi:hypothetical protein
MIMAFNELGRPCELSHHISIQARRRACHTTNFDYKRAEGVRTICPHIQHTPIHLSAKTYPPRLAADLPCTGQPATQLPPHPPTPARRRERTPTQTLTAKGGRVSLQSNHPSNTHQFTYQPKPTHPGPPPRAHPYANLDCQRAGGCQAQSAPAISGGHLCLTGPPRLFVSQAWLIAPYIAAGRGACFYGPQWLFYLR